MPSIDYFECEDCKFRWKDQGPFRFHLNENGEIEEFLLLMRYMDLDRDSNISGDIVETYCTNCNKKVKIYLITAVKNMDESEAISILKDSINNKISNKHMEQFIRETDLKDDCFIVDLSRNFYSNKTYHCPDCNCEISKYILSKNRCPKCDGDIKVVDGMCLDSF